MNFRLSILIEREGRLKGTMSNSNNTPPRNPLLPLLLRHQILPQASALGKFRLQHLPSYITECSIYTLNLF